MVTHKNVLHVGVSCIDAVVNVSCYLFPEVHLDFIDYVFIQFKLTLDISTPCVC